MKIKSTECWMKTTIMKNGSYDEANDTILAFRIKHVQKRPLIDCNINNDDDDHDEEFRNP